VLFAFLFMFCPFWYFLYFFIVELRFYKSNNWNFRVDYPSKWRPPFHYGPVSNGRNWVSNKHRMVQSYPLFLLATGLFFIFYCFEFGSADVELLHKLF
jgi:hypothetical protein